MTNRTKFITLVWFLIISSLVQGSFNSIVLCIENNGNIEVESSLYGECATDLNQTSTRDLGSVLLSESSVQERHCDSCLDIPLTISTDDNQVFFLSSVNLRQISTPDLPTISQEFPPGQSKTLVSPPVEHGHQTNSLIASIRTVIFLI